VPSDFSTFLTIIIPALAGAGFIAYAFQQIQRSAALGALVGAAAGGLGSMLFMVPLNYCTFDDGRGFVDHLFGLTLVTIGMLIGVFAARWLSVLILTKGGFKSLTASQSSMGVFKSRLTPWLLLSPSLVILVLFLYYPAAGTFRLSVLLARLGTSRTAFVCVDNFTRLMDSGGFTWNTLALLLVPIAAIVAIRWMNDRDEWDDTIGKAISAGAGLLVSVAAVVVLGVWVGLPLAVVILLLLRDETLRRSVLVYLLMAAAFVFFFDQILSQVLVRSYYQVVLSTFFISLAIVIIGLVLSLGIAYMAYQPIRGGSIYRTLLIWPYAISPPVAGIIFWLLFNPNAGIINHVIVSLGGERLPWLQSASLAPWTIIIASVWKSMGFNILFYIAGLQNVSNDLVEAAAIDGANAWKRFTNIIIPSLSPITFFLIITNITYAFFDIFGTVDYMTRGGPAGATSVMIYEIYKVGIQNVDLGKAAAQSVVLFGLVIGITYLQFRTSGQRVTYGA
jgi:sn-glycerol 3-phosphate transport system permease protein